jgi:hypothetical protein
VSTSLGAEHPEPSLPTSVGGAPKEHAVPVESKLLRANSDDVAQAFRNDLAQHSDLTSPGVSG